MATVIILLKKTRNLAWLMMAHMSTQEIRSLIQDLIDTLAVITQLGYNLSKAELVFVIIYQPKKLKARKETKS